MRHEPRAGAGRAGPARALHARFTLLPSLLLAAVWCLSLASPAAGQDDLVAPAVDAADAALQAPPPSDVRAFDSPSDRGRSITVRWVCPPASTGDAAPILGYRVERATSPQGPFAAVGQTPPGAVRYDDTDVENGTAYYYRVVTMRVDAEGASATVGPRRPSRSGST